MTDAELEVFLGIAGKKGCAEIMATVTPEKRALYERMATLEIEVRLWQEGLGPKPTGVIICGCGKRHKRRNGCG
jgi:hypothetical protein